MRCSKSCFLCDLGIVALFDVVEQGAFSGIIFLLTGQRNFVFTSPLARYRFLQPMSVSIFTLNTAAACANERPSSVYSITLSLKSLSYDIACVYCFCLYYKAISYIEGRAAKSGRLRSRAACRNSSVKYGVYRTGRPCLQCRIILSVFGKGKRVRAV